MENLEFKRNLKPLKWKKWFYIRAAAIVILLLIGGIFPKLALGNWKDSILLIIAAVFYLIIEYRYLTRIEKRTSRWMTFKITITPDEVWREFEDSAKKVIVRNNIKSIIQDNNKGLRINDETDDGIWIPADVTDFDTIVKLLESDLKKPDEALQIEFEKPPESLSAFIKTLQDNFGGISLVTTIVIILSYIKLYLYYAQYGINIYSYLDASEIIFSFTSLIKECVCLLVCFFIFHKSFEFIKIRKTELKDKIRDSAFTVQIIIFLIAIGYMLYGLPDFIQTKNNENSLLLQAFTMLLLFFLVFLFVFTLYISTLHFKFRERLVTLTFTFLFVILAFFLVTISENRISYNLIMNKSPKYSVELHLTNESKIISGDTLSYLGATNNYIFFRNIPDESNLIIPKAVVLKEKQKLLRRGL